MDTNFCSTSANKLEAFIKWVLEVTETSPPFVNQELPITPEYVPDLVKALTPAQTADLVKALTPAQTADLVKALTPAQTADLVKSSGLSQQTADLVKALTPA
jgi:hypothetical protein